MHRLNVVAVLYRWSLRWAARRNAIRPLDLERAMVKDLGGVRRRYLVLVTMGGRLLEFALIDLAAAFTTLGLSRLAGDGHPALASTLDYLATGIALFPIGLVAAILVWTLIPSPHEGGWYNHPGRLWAPTILGVVLTAVLAATDPFG